MASAVEMSESDIDVKVNGDLALQVIEESESDSDDNGEHPGIVQRKVMTLDKLKHIPAEIVPASHPFVYGNSVITNSENVHLGPNTYFHGNVTIKQIIHTKPGIENASYTKTEGEEISPNKNIKESASDTSVTSKFKFRLWHKVLCSVICLALVGAICANVLLLRNQDKPAINASQPSSNSYDPDSSNCVMVVGAYGIVLAYAVILLTITWVIAALITLLTRPSVGGRKHILPTPLPVYPHHAHERRLAEQLLIAPNHLRIVSRDDWLAQPPTGVLDSLRLPAPWVIIAHTATDSCFSQSKCVLRVRTVQSYHVDSRGWYDIGYNFLVGGDGSAYVGRGWDYVGAHTKGYNIYSISIAFIGTFTIESPPKQQVDACLKLINQGVELGKITKDYKLFAHRQLMSTASPGEKLFELMKDWPHFVSNVSDVDALLPKY